MGVPAYQLEAHVAVGAVLLLIVLYLPLFMKRSIPNWLLFGASSLALMLLGAVVVAMLSGHWPFRPG
jgi:hypothetical protein